jgi:hypothetical protein
MLPAMPAMPTVSTRRRIGKATKVAGSQQPMLASGSRVLLQGRDWGLVKITDAEPDGACRPCLAVQAGVQPIHQHSVHDSIGRNRLIHRGSFSRLRQETLTTSSWEVFPRVLKGCLKPPVCLPAGQKLRSYRDFHHVLGLLSSLPGFCSALSAAVS